MSVALIPIFVRVHAAVLDVSCRSTFPRSELYWHICPSDKQTCIAEYKAGRSGSCTRGLDGRGGHVLRSTACTLFMLLSILCKLHPSQESCSIPTMRLSLSGRCAGLTNDPLKEGRKKDRSRKALGRGRTKAINLTRQRDDKQRRVARWSLSSEEGRRIDTPTRPQIQSG